jgi:hypothetical protein
MIPQIITDISGVSLSATTDTMARNLIARLNAAYPAFDGFWRVTVNEKGGVVEVTNLRLPGGWGFLMHTAKIDSEGRKVVRAAGELLERYRISRDSRNAISSLRNAKRDFRGNLVADL